MERKQLMRKFAETLQKLVKETKEEKFSATELKVKLEDGTELSTSGEQLTVGAEIWSIDADGNQTPVDNGDYKTDDGNTITVTDGKISGIGEAEAKEEETPDQAEEMADEPKEEETPKEEEPKGDDVDKRIEAIEQAIADIMSMLKSQDQMNEQLMEKVDEFSKQPDADGVQITTQSFTNNERPLTKEELRIEMFKEMKNAIKNA